MLVASPFFQAYPFIAFLRIVHFVSCVEISTIFTAQKPARSEQPSETQVSLEISSRVEQKFSRVLKSHRQRVFHLSRLIASIPQGPVGIFSPSATNKEGDKSGKKHAINKSNHDKKGSEKLNIRSRSNVPEATPTRVASVVQEERDRATASTRRVRGTMLEAS